MKLKTLLFLESGMSYPSAGMGHHSMSSQDTKLRPMPKFATDVEDWDGITEHKDWFCYAETNNWDNNRSGATVTITEGEPHRFWAKIKTRGLKKPNDTIKGHHQRVKEHTKKVARSWMSAAKRLYKNHDLNEVGNPIPRTWAECFREALNDPKVSPFIESFGESKVSPIADPVNFTPRI